MTQDAPIAQVPTSVTNAKRVSTHCGQQNKRDRPSAGDQASFPPEAGRPLIAAIDSGNADKVLALLKKPTITANDFAGTQYAPIHAAAAKGNPCILELLLTHGADVHLRDKHLQGRTPIFYAVDWGQVQAVQLLIDNGAKVNAVTSHGYSVLHIAAAANQQSLDMVKTLVKHGANVNAVAPNMTTVLESAVQSGNTQALDFLLGAGADPEVLTYFGTTVVTAAVMGEEEDILQILLSRNVSLTHRDRLDGFAPLHHAAHSGSLHIVKMLLAAGADPSFPTQKGQLAEDIAQQRDHHDVAALLKMARNKALPSLSPAPAFP